MATNKTLFLDLDGVLADFDTAYTSLSGTPPDKLSDNVDWRTVVASPGFYATMPPMPDMAALWDYASTWPDVIVLTGVPASVPEAAADKQRWVTKHLGAHVKMIACRSREKCLHAQPGDILVDDWERYKSHWLEAGGVWITHTNAAESIAALKTHRK
jgi:hypothetical protein